MKLTPLRSSDSCKALRHLLKGTQIERGKIHPKLLNKRAGGGGIEYDLPGEMCQSSPDAFCGTKTGAEIVELGKYRLNAHILSIQGIKRFNSALHIAPQVGLRAIF